VEKCFDDSDTDPVAISRVLVMTTWWHAVQYVTVNSQNWRWNTSGVKRLMNLALVFCQRLCWMFKYTDYMLPCLALREASLPVKVSQIQPHLYCFPHQMVHTSSCPFQSMGYF